LAIIQKSPRKKTPQKQALLMCSTPYGINGFGTIEINAIDPLRCLCSTPYGINGFGTCFADIGSDCCYSAQRLTASMVSAHDEVFSNSSFSCAQRLTASMVSALASGL
jgi:hypothetical protein